MKKTKEIDPLNKFVQKKVLVELKHGKNIEGHLVNWDKKEIVIQQPMKFDWSGKPVNWKLSYIERYKISKIQPI